MTKNTKIWLKKRYLKFQEKQFKINNKEKIKNLEKKLSSITELVGIENLI